MDLKIISAAAVGLVLASCADTEVPPPEVRCERLGLAEGSNDYANCFYVLSSLDKADKSLKTDLSLECAKGPFEFAHCAVWFTRDKALRETIDENAIKGFQAMMDEKEDIKAKIQDRCREKLRENELEMTNDNLYKCIVIESNEHYELVNSKKNDYYKLLKNKSDEYIEYFYKKGVKYYEEGSNKSKKYYETGHDKANEYYDKAKKYYDELPDFW